MGRLWRPGLLRAQPHGLVSPGGAICRPDPAGCAARGPARRAAGPVRAGHQPADHRGTGAEPIPRRAGGRHGRGAMNDALPATRVQVRPRVPAAAPIPRSTPRQQGQLFRKYMTIFVALVSGALLLSGLVELYFSYQENQAALVTLQREK